MRKEAQGIPSEEMSGHIYFIYNLSRRYEIMWSSMLLLKVRIF